MHKIRAIIIDDEEMGRVALRNMVRDYCKQTEVIAEADDVGTGIAAIRKHKPDLVFLDIEMTTGTGFDLLAKLQPVDFEVIFTTAYAQYAIRAFKTAALAYLLKPVDLQDLVAAEQKIIARMGEKDSFERVKVLLESIHNRPRKIALPTLEGALYPEVHDILRLEAQGSYTFVYFMDGRRLMVSGNLKVFEDMLLPHGFFRSHKSHLINLQYVREYQKGKVGTLVLVDGSSVKLSPGKKQEFLEKMDLG